jgi:hypothetical protein
MNQPEENTMSKIESHPPGEFCWVELGTTDLDAGRDFYTKLLNWTVRDGSMGGMTYYIFQSQGNDAAGAYTLMKEQTEQGVPPHWLPYVAVMDVKESAARAAELGGKILGGPCDVGEQGSFAVIRDPQGATFSVWQAGRHIGSQAGDVNFRHCWTELATTDAQAAKEFYTRLFDWGVHTQPMANMDYTTWLNQGRPNGGMLQMNEQWAGVPPHWMVYFSVPDCDDAAKLARELGGTVKCEPFDIPGVGRMSVLADPQGALFSVINLKMPA